MARSITRELGGRGITANVVGPGFIDTDMTAGPARGPRATSYLAAIPAGRFAHPEEVAAASSASSPAPTPHTSAVP